ncbi:hypothetical protein CL652_01370 [bacterium]|nr:hypothetical protein [bacterium]|tara:strand:+ start:414 stop:707 length:294 start_codon:yes stop_codon:yes gene_type:complete
MKKHRWMNDDTDELMLAMLQLKSLAEARAFFGDLLTEKEIRGAANRWKAAKMLDFGVGYRKIERVTGMSSATVSRIRRKMEEGLGGYRLMMGKLRQK